MSGESRELRESGVTPWWHPAPTPTPKTDLEYFHKKLLRGLKLGHDTRKIAKQIDLLEDALEIYREQRLLAVSYGGTVTESREDFVHRYMAHKNKTGIPVSRIPNSLLVQTFMRKVQHG